MKAVLCNGFGSPDDLAIAEVPDPEPGPGEIRCRVRAAGLNFFDTLIIKGRYQERAEPPFSPGGEFVGEVEALGPGVETPIPGTRVIAYPKWGACAEKIVIPAAAAVAIPHGLADEIAAGLLITYGTTLHALRDRARLQPGETLAVLGASGGVGLAAIEIGKILGARVIACASDDDKLDLCRETGADDLVNYRKADLKSGLKAVVPAGVDVVYDSVGGDYSEAALRAIGWNGRHLVIGFASGDIPRVALNLTLVKGCSLVGVFWGRFAEEEPQRFAENTRQLVAWCVDGTLRPHIDRILPLAETASGLNRILARKARGKVVVTP